ncbi:MAG: hypothetical protein OEX00_07490 [Gammaproteobacteria bacterium]|nr:hypothetical protein [Gammaproteobacteria bacterium]MDH5693208.1 hypothetical protein [Gammaproteobacteria bacterium]
MPTPTIEKRLEKRLILMTTNSEFAAQIERLCAEKGWIVVQTRDLSSIGEWNEVLLHRILLMDLEEFEAFDPIDVIREIRMQMQINIPVLCFGGDKFLQDEMRLARADRFFSQQELLSKLPLFLEQYNW